MAATPVWSRPYPFHCPSWTRSLRVTHELRGRQPQWLCSEFVSFLLLFDCQEAFHCCLVVTCINRINMISIQCHRVGECWSGKPEFENVSDPAGVYIPFKYNVVLIEFWGLRWTVEWPSYGMYRRGLGWGGVGVGVRVKLERPAPHPCPDLHELLKMSCYTVMFSWKSSSTPSSESVSLALEPATQGSNNGGCLICSL